METHEATPALSRDGEGTVSAWVLILMFATNQNMATIVVDMPTEAVCRRELRLLEERKNSNNLVRGMCLNRSP